MQSTGEESGSQRTLAVRCLTIRSRDPNTQSDVTASQDDIKMGPGNGPVTNTRQPARTLQDAAGLATPTCHVGSTEGVRWKGYPSKLLHAAAFRVAKTP